MKSFLIWFRPHHHNRILTSATTNLGFDVKDTNIYVEVWRYYLLTNRPEKDEEVESLRKKFVGVKPTGRRGKKLKQ
ncbi:hypothetical protein L3X38_003901 [Prunus dulcis]|uniref:Uncharacterized protein n=1 Tax=Prunus dulcis TaxID=3755 RepID=A0AAD4ZMV3_PRUDU|nr:hypothetical protein L3X38_003901 [Prunus dulcis]